MSTSGGQTHLTPASGTWLPAPAPPCWPVLPAWRPAHSPSGCCLQTPPPTGQGWCSNAKGFTRSSTRICAGRRKSVSGSPAQERLLYIASFSFKKRTAVCSVTTPAFPHWDLCEYRAGYFALLQYTTVLPSEQLLALYFTSVFSCCQCCLISFINT